MFKRQVAAPKHMLHKLDHVNPPPLLWIKASAKYKCNVQSILTLPLIGLIASKDKARIKLMRVNTTCWIC